MKYVIVILLLFSTVSSLAEDACPTYKHIIRINPHLNKEYAKDLAATIEKTALKYKLSPNKLTAILMQESSLRMGIKSKTKDYGIGQIHISNIKRLGFDKNKLMTDLEYSVEATAIILNELKSTYNENNYWTRYHSFRPSNREVYKRLVKRYL